jgi:hypothetical protein
MFSAKNYGLPKDLIEAAKRVHEKQLEKDSHGKMPSKEHVMKMLKDGMSETEMMKMHSDVDKGKLKKLVKDCKEEMNEERSSDRKVYNIKGAGKFSQPLIDPEVPNILKDLKNRKNNNTSANQKQKAPPLPVRNPKNEEVQFTEEELAEAFAIFLEENFHVEMLTEEDLDYVFENEFPQWLEETAAATRRRSRQQQTPGMTVSDVAKKVFFPFADKDKPSARSNFNDMGNVPAIKKIPTGQHELDAGRPTSKPTPASQSTSTSTAREQVTRPAPKIDYKTPVTRRGPDGTYGLTKKGLEYVARKERKKRFNPSNFFSQMQQDGN